MTQMRGMVSGGLAARPVAGDAHADREVRRVTAWGLVANLALAGLKLVAGLISASQALIADSVHSLSDSSTDIAILIGARYWSAPADDKHPYGHGRIETIITAAIGIVLAAVGVGIGYHAVTSMHQGHTGIPGWTAFVAACISMVVKELLYRWTVGVGRRCRSSAVVANAWHHRSDAMSSLPVAVAVAGSHIRSDWTSLDHVGAIIVSVLICHAAVKISWPALAALADAGASAEQRKQLTAQVMRIDGVRNVHALRTRQVGTGLQVDLHVLVDATLTVHAGHEIAGIAKARLLDDQAVVDVLVHIEPYDPNAN